MCSASRTSPPGPGLLRTRKSRRSEAEEEEVEEEEEEGEDEAIRRATGAGFELERFQRGQEGVKLGKVMLLFIRRW